VGEAHKVVAMLPMTLNHVLRDELTLALTTGTPIMLFDKGLNLYLKGRIMGISLESGFTPPSRPRHFNVTLHVQDSTCRPELANTTREVYVRTAD
jgi:hypothetical protein